MLWRPGVGSALRHMPAILHVRCSCVFPARTPTRHRLRGSGTVQLNGLLTTRSTGALSESHFRGSACESLCILPAAHSIPIRYKNYHLFSFVPVQERLSGRVLDTAYLGAVGLWIPVSQRICTAPTSFIPFLRFTYTAHAHLRFLSPRLLYVPVCTSCFHVLCQCPHEFYEPAPTACALEPCLTAVQIPNPQALAHSVQGNDIHISARR